MNAAPRRFWRPVRSFLILACVGGAVLAADKNWLNELRFDFDPADWWANLSPAETPSSDVAIATQPASLRAPELSMSRLLNGLLFAKPSSGWRLDAEQADLTSAWITEQSSGNLATVSSAFRYSQPESFSAGFVTKAPSASPLAPNAPTATGNWVSTFSSNWSNPDAWSGNVIADGAGNTANFNAADLTSNITVTLDTSRTIGNLYIGDTNGTNSYMISPSSGATLTFDSGASGTASNLQQTSTSAGDAIAAGILIKNDLNINNLSATNPFTISGNIAASSGSGTYPTIWFNNHDTSTGAAAGNINVTGNISNGTASQLTVVVVKGGTVTLTGTNSYTGFTEVNGGTLLINGDNGGATGNVYVYNGGTLGGTGTVGGSVNVYGGTVTGGTATSVGTLTLKGNANFNSGEGGGGHYLANISGATSDLLAITGTLTLGGTSSLTVSGTLDGVTTYTIATFESLYLNLQFGSTSGIPGNYMIVYDPHDIELVPTAIPEPATWIGGALALGAVACAKRSRKRKALL